MKPESLLPRPKEAAEVPSGPSSPVSSRDRRGSQTRRRRAPLSASAAPLQVHRPREARPASHPLPAPPGPAVSPRAPRRPDVPGWSDSPRSRPRVGDPPLRPAPALRALRGAALGRRQGGSRGAEPAAGGAGARGAGRGGRGGKGRPGARSRLASRVQPPRAERHDGAGDREGGRAALHGRGRLQPRRRPRLRPPRQVRGLGPGPRPQPAQRASQGEARGGSQPRGVRSPLLPLPPPQPSPRVSPAGSGGPRIHQPRGRLRSQEFLASFRGVDLDPRRGWGTPPGPACLSPLPPPRGLPAPGAQG